VQIEQEFALRARCRLATNRRSRRFDMSFAPRVASFSAGVTGGNVGQMFSGTGNRETFLVEEALDFENGFDVVAAVEAMAAGTFYRLQRRKFAFPVTQDEGFGRRQTAYFADAEKALFGNFRCGMCSGGHMFSVSYYSEWRVRRWKLAKAPYLRRPLSRLPRRFSCLCWRRGPWRLRLSRSSPRGAMWVRAERFLRR
jgi:hypothetical protein